MTSTERVQEQLMQAPVGVLKELKHNGYVVGRRHALLLAKFFSMLRRKLQVIGFCCNSIKRFSILISRCRAMKQSSSRKIKSKSKVIKAKNIPTLNIAGWEEVFRGSASEKFQEYLSHHAWYVLTFQIS